MKDAHGVINFVCFDCGEPYITENVEMLKVTCTWWMGKCDKCGEETAITDARNFGMRDDRERNS